MVDMQNAFVSKGGMFDIAGMDISGAKDVIEKNRITIDTARKAGCKIVFLSPMAYRTLQRLTRGQIDENVGLAR